MTTTTGGDNGKPLSDCPSNLKEAIDWVLRVTGKDNGKDDNTVDLAKEVKTLLDKAGVNGSYGTINIGTCGTGSCSGANNNLCCLINKLGDVFKNFLGWNGSGDDKVTGQGIGKKGNNGDDGYKSSYGDSATWKEDTTNTSTYRKIFLGIIPLLFSSLSYLYWICNNKWKNDNINDTNDDSLCQYIQ